VRLKPDLDEHLHPSALWHCWLGHLSGSTPTDHVARGLITYLSPWQTHEKLARNRTLSIWCEKLLREISCCQSVWHTYKFIARVNLHEFLVRVSRTCVTGFSTKDHMMANKAHITDTPGNSFLMGEVQIQPLDDAFVWIGHFVYKQARTDGANYDLRRRFHIYICKSCILRLKANSTDFNFRCQRHILNLLVARHCGLNHWPR